MNATTRTARRILRDRTRTQRAAARIRRNHTATLTTHGIATGLTRREAASMAQTLRKEAKRNNITGTPTRTHAGRHMRDALCYTPAQVAAIATTYRPRKPAFKIAAAILRLAA
jgi:hypothetical protein